MTPAVILSDLESRFLDREFVQCLHIQGAEIHVTKDEVTAEGLHGGVLDVGLNIDVSDDCDATMLAE